MSQASDQIIWEVCKKNNASRFYQRNGGFANLSRDKLNLSGRNSFKYTGYRKQAVGIYYADPKDRTLAIRHKRTDIPTSKPSKNVKITKVAQKGFSKRALAAINLTKGLFYRKDLTRAAVRRVHKLEKASNNKNKVAKTKEAAPKA